LLSADGTHAITITSALSGDGTTRMAVVQIANVCTVADGLARSRATNHPSQEQIFSNALPSNQELRSWPG